MAVSVYFYRRATPPNHSLHRTRPLPLSVWAAVVGPPVNSGSVLRLGIARLGGRKWRLKVEWRVSQSL